MWDNFEILQYFQLIEMTDITWYFYNGVKILLINITQHQLFTHLCIQWK